MPSFLGVPDVVWSGVIASAIAFIGVALSNRSNTARLELQLRHDANEKMTQRRAEVRRAVYLEFAESFGAANQHIGDLPGKLSDGNLSDGLRAFHAAVAKAQLVANIDTTEAIDALMEIHTKFFLKSTLRVMPIARLKAQIQAEDEIFENAKTEAQRIQSDMAAFVESAKTDQAVYSALALSLKIQSNFRDSAAERRSKLHADLLRLQAEYVDFVQTDIKSIMLAGAPVLAAFRRELEIDGYAVDFQRKYIERVEKIHAEIKTVATELVTSLINDTPAK